MKSFYVTKGVYSKAEQDNEFRLFIFKSWARFKKEDWGDVCESDKLANDGDPDYALAAYVYKNGVKIWISGSGTYATVMFPDEY